MKNELWWATHNLIAHPVMQLLYFVGLGSLGNKLHDWTIPHHEYGNGHG